MSKSKKSGCNHDELAIQLACTGCGHDFEQRTLSRAEMEAKALELPDREAMSLVNLNAAAPINLALAANVLSDNSVAVAQAVQTAPIIQRT
jgi:hypothetical protein